MELKQYLKLSQQLVITPQLQQAIKLLQLNHQELKQEIEGLLNENPCLETEATSSDEPKPEELKALIKSALDNSENSTFSRNTASKSTDSPPYEQLIAKPESLADYLFWQVRHSPLKDIQVKIAESIIGNLDERGYLKITVAFLVEKFHTPEEEVQAILYTIQQLDPVGIASRNLRECLLNQLWSIEVKNETTQLAEKILEDQFDLFLKRNVSSLVKKLHTPKENVIEACHLLSQLNPKPGSAFHEPYPHPESITPDVFIQKVGDKYRISLNEEGLPRLKVSRHYLKLLEGKPNKKDVRYVQEKIKSALWFIKSIEQRNQSIIKVAKSLLKYQSAFFKHGPSHIAPLVLRQVAQDVDLHESTISRVTKGKYVQTPHGLFELKYFFNSKIQALDQEVGSQTVKLKIRSLIASESPETPYSDEQLKDKLKAFGISIARRTIAKYREMMRILPSNARKKRF